MFLKFKCRRSINDFLNKSGMNKNQIDYILSKNLDKYVKSIKILKKSPFFHTENPNFLEGLLVSTAEEYMDHLLNIEQNKIEKDTDIIKLHFCISIMIVVTADQWAPMRNQILRFDLWHKHWKQINELGAYFIKQPVVDAPFVNVLNNMIIANAGSGLLQLESEYPLEAITKLVVSEYN